MTTAKKIIQAKKQNTRFGLSFLTEFLAHQRKDLRRSYRKNYLVVHHVHRSEQIQTLLNPPDLSHLLNAIGGLHA